MPVTATNNLNPSASESGNAIRWRDRYPPAKSKSATNVHAAIE